MNKAKTSRDQAKEPAMSEKELKVHESLHRRAQELAKIRKQRANNLYFCFGEEDINRMLQE